MVCSASAGRLRIAFAPGLQLWDQKRKLVSSTENRDTFPPAWSGDDAEPRPLSADSVARKLREVRTGSHQELDDVAHALRIRYDYLLAIEEGRFEDLPGPTYAVGFVRAYADYLKLDTEDIASRFKAEVADFTRRTELVFPSPEPETRIPGSLIFLASAVLIAGAYGVWYFSSSGSDQVAAPPSVDEIPEVPAAEAPAPRPNVSVAELPEAPTGFVDPSDTDPASAEPQAVDPGGAPVDAGLGAQVAAAESAATDAIELPAPAAEADLAATPEVVEASPAESAAADDQSPTALPAEVVAAVPSDLVEDNDATVEAAPPASGPESEETTVEQAAAEAAEAPAEAEVAKPAPAEVPVDEPAAEPAAETSAEEAPASEAGAPAESGVPDQAGSDRETTTVVVARGTETAETQVEAQPEPRTGSEAPPSAVLRQREGVTVAPLPPQAPTRQPAAQPEPVQTAALGESEPEAPAVYGDVNGESRIVVRAIFDSYVLIRDADDKLILTKVLRRGETYRVPDQQGLTMLTGNAGGLQIEVDGQAAPSVGAVGAIVRNINLDPTRLKSGTATNP
jgi:cytoskeletal protein RodZ